MLWVSQDNDAERKDLLERAQVCRTRPQGRPAVGPPEQHVTRAWGTRHLYILGMTVLGGKQNVGKRVRWVRMVMPEWIRVLGRTLRPQTPRQEAWGGSDESGRGRAGRWGRIKAHTRPSGGPKRIRF